MTEFKSETHRITSRFALYANKFSGMSDERMEGNLFPMTLRIGRMVEMVSQISELNLIEHVDKMAKGFAAGDWEQVRRSARRATTLANMMLNAH
jgi:hypothetical protein